MLSRSNFPDQVTYYGPLYIKSVGWSNIPDPLGKFSKHIRSIGNKKEFVDEIIRAKNIDIDKCVPLRCPL